MIPDPVVWREKDRLRERPDEKSTGGAGAVRVVWLAQAFPRHREDLPGNFLLRLGAALADHDVQVRVLAPAARGLAGRDRLGPVQVRRYRYAPRRLQTLAYTGAMDAQARGLAGRGALAGLVAAGALAARRAMAGADLVHAHWWFPGGSQAVAARALGGGGEARRPLLVTLHGSDVGLALGRPAAGRLARRVLGAADQVTAVSGWLAGQAVELVPALQGRVQVAPMPVDDRLFTPGAGGRPRDELLVVGPVGGVQGGGGRAARVGLVGRWCGCRAAVAGGGGWEPGGRPAAPCG